MNNVKEAVESLKKGNLIILVDDDHREAEGDMVGLASKVTPEKINFIVSNARGVLCAPLSPNKVKQLQFKPMTEEHDPFDTPFLCGTDHKDTTTGVSAYDRATTISNLAKDDAKSSDFYKPGHIFPLRARKNGLNERQGHTEGSIELAKLANENVTYICEILKEDGHMARKPELVEKAKKWGLDIITIPQLQKYIKDQELDTEE